MSRCAAGRWRMETGRHTQTQSSDPAANISLRFCALEVSHHPASPSPGSSAPSTCSPASASLQPKPCSQGSSFWERSSASSSQPGSAGSAQSPDLSDLPSFTRLHLLSQLGWFLSVVDVKAMQGGGAAHASEPGCSLLAAQRPCYPPVTAQTKECWCRIHRLWSTMP